MCACRPPTSRSFIVRTDRVRPTSAISSFTWLLLYQNAQDKQRAKIMAGFLKWALTDGQKLASELRYAPLPRSVVDKEMQALAKLQVHRCPNRVAHKRP